MIIDQYRVLSKSKYNIFEKIMLPGENLRSAAIALQLGRWASTISRELRRDGWTHLPARRVGERLPVAGGYRTAAAHKRAHLGPVRA
jgi:IS30 family transposase